ncbi:MAG: DUF2202 domain-containing protein [Prolixibacteraceae bacterium]|nr:DUF2202 domain-containing protein [Prolixibacteraceae bacterium]
MKTKVVTLIAIATAALFIISCSESINSIGDAMEIATSEKSMEATAASGDSCTFSGILSETDIAGLMEMREEEKLAHDVYTYLFDLHDYIIFSNISKSESAHTSAVLNLINGYGLDDPTPAEEGVYNNEIFNEMYSSLTSAGTGSLIEALKVGALIEETDIDDLIQLIESTENEDILRVYNHLLSASKIHLRAFTNALARLGESYSPVVISVEDYLEIIGEATENNSAGETIHSTTPGVCDGTGPNA